MLPMVPNITSPMSMKTKTSSIALKVANWFQKSFRGVATDRLWKTVEGLLATVGAFILMIPDTEFCNIESSTGFAVFNNAVKLT